MFKLVLVFFILVSLAGYINLTVEKPPIKINKQESAININEEFVSLLFASQKRLVSDLYWIGTLLESDLDHYKNRDLNSWMFHRFRTIVHLDPKFYAAYLFGGQYLAIVKDDIEGAGYIYKKGLKHYPSDYDLLFNAGFLFAFELDDYKFAIPIYEKLIKMPQAPPYMVTVLHKLKYKGEDLSLKDTFNSLLAIYKTTNEEEDKFLHHRLKTDLYRIKAELDLNCLNSNSNDCDKVDFNGKPYVRIDGIFQAQEDFEPYDIYKK